MKVISTLFTLAFLVSITGEALSKSYDLPSFGDSVLKEQFPVYQEMSDVERGLRRYKSDLEDFRQDSLEGYNRAISEYRENLVEADRKLEIDRKKGRIDQAEYLESHNYIKRELKNSRGSGKYFKAYFTYLNKYKSKVKWVNTELAVAKKKGFVF